MGEYPLTHGRMMNYKELVSYFFPAGLLDWFDLEKVEEGEAILHIWLTEKNTVPPDVPGTKVLSKGFYPERKVLDYPVRDRALALHIKCRRWERKDTGKEIRRDLKWIAEGTKYTQDFADFLKEVD